VTLPANDNLVSGTTQSITAYSASWSLGAGAMNATVNGAVGNSTGADSIAFWNADAFPNDQYANVTVNTTGTTGNSTGPAVRCAAGTNGYSLRLVPSQSAWNLVKQVAGVKTVIATGSLTISIGDSFQLTVQGTLLTALQNGVQFFSASDSALSSGSAGISGFSTAGPALTTWQGGAAVATVPTLPRRIFVLP